MLRLPVHVEGFAYSQYEVVDVDGCQVCVCDNKGNASAIEDALNIRVALHTDLYKRVTELESAVDLLKHNAGLD